MAESGTKIVLSKELIEQDEERRRRQGVEQATIGSENYGEKAVLTEQEKVAIQNGAESSKTRHARAMYMASKEGDVARRAESAWERDTGNLPRSKGAPDAAGATYYVEFPDGNFVKVGSREWQRRKDVYLDH